MMHAYVARFGKFDVLKHYVRKFGRGDVVHFPAFSPTLAHRVMFPTLRHIFIVRLLPACDTVQGRSHNF